MKLLILMCAAAMASPGQPNQPPAPLVHYSFDDDQLDAGPDTFAVFQFGQGTVRLSSLQRYSGYRSVELRDTPGDRSFPELQGYFPLRAKGKLYLHFAFMTADPAEELNIALAGPQWFRLRKHGIAFWLKTSGGYLTAVSDSMPRKLLPLLHFTWYLVDVAYDIDAGIYDMTIRQEGIAEPVLTVRNQPNASNQPGSQVDKFSFIGDHESDLSQVVYYVDDVLVGADETIALRPFAAPGRRKLFFDYWAEAQRARAARPQPLPMTSLADVGIGESEIAALRSEQGGAPLGDILAGRAVSLPDTLGGRSRVILTSMLAWRAGHAALLAGKAEDALAHFDRAAQQSPAPAPLIKMDAVMALAHLGRWEEVDQRLPVIAADWRGDPRLPVALAMIGLARQDLQSVSSILAEGAATMDESIAEQYFLALLWEGERAQAEQLGAAMLAGASDRNRWSERMGDAAFVAGDFERARAQYEASLTGNAAPTSVWLKLSDVHFKLGDLEKERTFRERIYGSLEGR